MGLIKVLPEILINKIAAGEVVERPASVVKELIENSIDAGANEIVIEILRGGKKLIRVSDNGLGMSKEDAILAFERHATSKIYDEDDLYKISTMGFRGEALPSIASVSKVLMVTSEKGSSSGIKIEMDGGKLLSISDVGPSPGTVVEVRDLFFNTPARLAFLKGDNTEISHIVGTVESEALGHPEISFTLKHNKKVILSLPRTNRSIERIHQIYGRGVVENLLEVRSGPLSENNRITLTGYISNPPFSRADRSLQAAFINKRPIRNLVISHAISEGYHTLMMKDRYAVAFLFLDIDSIEVDINVHPAKREVRLRNPSLIHDIIAKSIRERLSEKTTEETFQIDGEKIDLPGVKEAIERYMKRYEKASLEEERQIDFGLPLRLKSTISKDFLHAFESYIIAVNKDSVMIIDQHAAHERILYEKLKKEKIEIQRLLVPETIELSKKESLLLAENLDKIKTLGLDVEGFGSNTFIIRSIPAILQREDPKGVLLDILTELEKSQGLSRTKEVERMKTLMACHGAIKASQPLNPEEMENLMEELKGTELSHTCPHGRPTMIKLRLSDLEKLFKRK